MFCPECGKQLQPSSGFCLSCEKATIPGHCLQQPMMRPLTHRMFAGVCAAFALHNGWDLHLTRFVALLLIIFTGFGALAYLAAWIIIPQERYPLSLKRI
jgi:phage shock protein C